MKLNSIEPQTDYSEIKSEGMIETVGGWIKIQSIVLPYKETPAAYYAFLRVDEVVDDGKFEMLYKSSKTEWIPKSMTENVWWICTKKFDETRKISNRVFSKKQNYKNDSNDYDPYKAQQEEEF